MEEGHKEVEFHLRVENQMLELDIADDGCGFDLTAASEAGYGLKNIPQRLARLGGPRHPPYVGCPQKFTPDFPASVWPAAGGGGRLFLCLARK